MNEFWSSTNRGLLRFVLIFLILDGINLGVLGQSIGRFYVVKDGPKEIDSLGSFQFLAQEPVLFNNGYKRLDNFIKYYNDSLFAGTKIAIMIKPATKEETSDGELCNKRLQMIIDYLMQHTGLKTNDLISACVPANPPSGFISFAKLPGVKPSNLKVKYAAPTKRSDLDLDRLPKFDKWRSSLSDYLDENISCGSNKESERVKIFVQLVIDSVGFVKKGSVAVLNGGDKITEACRKRLVKILEKSPQWSPAHNSKLNRYVTAKVVLPINF